MTKCPSWLTEKWTTVYIETFLHRIREDYLDTKLRLSKGINEINWYMDHARYNVDPTYLIKAHTAETDYYKLLNEHLASVKGTEADWSDRGKWYIVRIMCTHPALDRFSFTGMSYQRGTFTENQFTVGSLIMNKVFLSTSKDRQVLEQAAADEQSAMYIFEIRKHGSAMDIESISEYPQEKEILIHPFCVFKVVSIKCNSIHNEVEIELRQNKADKNCCIQ
ncbi:unnamed protein product [Didymodactylos carnosus]|uniref:NAD(P)(+)--arginine ADP-ribosyltransferase n=1 Tax=Didymodactylos carnosus TaxID=1234261 RepID=A0A816CFW7_9BILA|nr:unnamed protein product [Didymodactylos carnosus]CAF1624236.1 unnamed protein product [Didymodactylos carnosus]CAF4356999.1 unnamed protein product [Didymodactylos carnosus]CAF4516891.1 unnamed protein product [Didymodactylos carnosus]